MSTFTVVFNFSDEKLQADMTASWRDHFITEKRDDFNIIAMSHKDEMTKMDLIQFGHDIDDMDFIGEVLDERDLEGKFARMMAAHEYADKHSVTEAYADEILMA